MGSREGRLRIIHITRRFNASPGTFTQDTSSILRIHMLIRATGDQGGNNPPGTGGTP